MTKPLPNGTRVRLLPKEGVIVGFRTYERGRTKATTTTYHAYLIELADGSREDATPADFEIVENEQKGACNE